MSTKKKVLDLGSDSEDESAGKITELAINKNYAERYDKWRSSEELQKLKDRYGDIGDDEDDESSSSSEEEWTVEKEKEFFKTFSLLKKKDPKIYDSNVRFFQTEEKSTTEDADVSAKKSKKEKAYLLKDHERKMLLEKGGLVDEDEDAPKPEPSYVEEQESIKKGFSKALQQIDSGDEGDDLLQSDLLKKREKTAAEEENEEEEYRKWLKGEVEKAKGGDDDLKFLRDYWTDPNLNEDEKFLRDYILNQKYREPEDKNYIPTYDEVVHDSDEEGLSGDEANVQKMEEFEHKYNFRFEEPDQEFIKRYPRTVESSLRRTDDKRKRQREAAKERKEAEKARKREEIQRLKALKRKEILEKIQQLEEITGDPELIAKIEDKDLEGDFDPEEHDRRMQKIFNEEYYGEAEEEKPVFPYDEELDEEWKAYCPDDDLDEEDEESDGRSRKKSKTKTETSVHNETGGGSETERPSTSQEFIQELIEVSKGKKQKKKKSVFMEALERAKPKFDPSTYESFEKYFDEYYKLDFEDLVGDLPCRFKYRKVVPNDFGLSVDEILKAPDRELNQWASLKKTFQYRAPEEEKYDLQAYQKKAENVRLKQKVLPSLFKPDEEEEETETNNPPASDQPPSSAAEIKKNKKKKKKKKKKKPAATAEPAVSEPTAEDQSVEPPSEPSEPSQSKKKRKHEQIDNNTVNAIPSADSTESESPKKKKKKQQEPSSDLREQPSADTTINGSTESEEGSGKKKNKKNKNKALQNGNASTADNTQDISVSSSSQNELNGTQKSNKEKKMKRKHDNQDHQQQQQKKMKKHKGKSDSGSVVPKVDDDRLRAYGINPNKFKKQLKYGNKN